MQYFFRKADLQELPQIWAILQQATLRRKAEGSKQWQDGYPNPAVIQHDIEKEIGFVLVDGKEVVGYCAVLENDEPAYTHIDGEWLSHGNFLVIHRVAVSEKYLGQGLAKKILEAVEQLALDRQIYSVKADTNFDNPAMMHVFEKLGYSYCGEVLLRGALRKAYEKVLVKTG